jgi:hypothetical protein
MPIVTQVLCDGCHAVKRETNHWYSLTVHEDGVTIGPLKMTPEGQPCIGRGTVQQYFCGRYCVLEALTRWMDLLSQIAVASGDHGTLESVHEGRVGNPSTTLRPLKALL